MRCIFLFLLTCFSFLLLSCTKSVEDSLKEFRKQASPSDHLIFEHGKKYFPKWDLDSQLRWLNELLPQTDAGATEALMEVANENDLLLPWDRYALQLPPGKERERVRDVLGALITQRYWEHTLEITPDGTYVLRLKDMRSGAECAFRAKFDDPVPKEGKLVINQMNSDLEVGYRNYRIIRNGTSVSHMSEFKTLFEVRRDAETNQWFETGRWDEIRKKIPAVTTYEEIRNVPVCTEIIGEKGVFRTFRLNEESRNFKLGKLNSGDILSSPPEAEP